MARRRHPASTLPVGETQAREVTVDDEGWHGTEFMIPLQAATSTFGILAKRGAGKSNAAVVMAEAMHAADVPWVAVDPKGDWWGIRANSDGTGPGLPIVVFGGKHGDVPLESTAGKMLADLILEHRLTCVLDVSEFTKAETSRFLLAFAERLYRQADDDPMHLFLEEAHEYLPQMVRGDQANMVNAWQRIVKAGRFKGIGCTLISQRSAAVNKDVLTQVDTLIVLRTTSPQDRAAVKAWIDTHAAAAEVLRDLPKLPDGEAYVWSPESLDVDLQHVRFARRWTFDSGATPVVGQKRRAPATLADVDLEAIRVQMADTIEKAKADDPAELRKRISELTKRLNTALEERDAARAETHVVNSLAWFPDNITEQMHRHIEALMTMHNELDDKVEELSLALDVIDRAYSAAAQVATSTQLTFTTTEGASLTLGDKLRAAKAPTLGRIADHIATGPKPIPAAKPVLTIVRDKPLQRAERAILSVLAQYPQGRSMRQVALLTGYSGKGGGFRNALSSLRSQGLIERGDPIVITDVGRATIAGETEPLPTGPDLLEHWCNQLGRAERMILQALFDGRSMSVDELSDRTGYSAAGGGFRNALSKLRTLELINRGPAIDLTDDFRQAIT